MTAWCGGQLANLFGLADVHVGGYEPPVVDQAPGPRGNEERRRLSRPARKPPTPHTHIVRRLSSQAESVEFIVVVVQRGCEGLY
eukprot:scaffold135422_cov32-Prasinocladus_malaysianus.AAC.1